MELFLTHCVATWFMVGLIWFVQVVHYPLFGRVGKAGYEAYQRDHMRLTTWVVGSPMVIEAISGVGLLFWFPEGMFALWFWVNLGLLVLIWISTVVWQVPRHNVLLAGFDKTAHRRLVVSNWVRTIAWSIRGILLLWILLEVLG